MTQDIDQELERARFVEDLLSYMTLEEKLGQLDLFHAADDPALEKAVTSGRVGGVASAASPARLQSLAVERSRLGIPLLLASEPVGLALSPWALAASWDVELAKSVGAAAAAASIGDGFNCIRAPRAGDGRGADTKGVHIAACEPHLLAALTAAFAEGADGEGQHQRSTVLAIPEWSSKSAGDGLAWAHKITHSGRVAAVDCAAFGRTAAQRAGFSGILIAECQRITAIVRGQFAVTSARSPIETAERILATGILGEAEIDMATRGVLAAKHRLGLFREPQRVVAPPTTGSPFQRDGERVRATFVLLRNEAGILPLSPVSDRILVVGPAGGAAAICADALGRAGIGHSMAPGLAQRRDDESWSTPIAGDQFAISLTSDAARRADFAVVVLDHRHFSKAADGRWHRPTLATLALLRGLSLTGTRMIAILATAEPVDLADADQFFAVVLQCWQPTSGLEEALSDVLSGRFSPQGRMPASAGRFLSGHGLGYGETLLSNYRLAARADHVVASVAVRNSGSFETRETVQVYASARNGEIRLIEFANLHLAPTDTRSVDFELGLEALGAPGAGGTLELAPGSYTVFVGKNSGRVLEASVEITPALARAITMRGHGFLRLAAG